jgi:hypothetical protein
MLLADAEKVHDIVVEVVQDFNLRGLFAEEHLRAAGERLDVRCMLGKNCNDLIGERALAADVR